MGGKKSIKARQLVFQSLVCAVEWDKEGYKNGLARSKVAQASSLWDAGSRA